MSTAELVNLSELIQEYLWSYLYSKVYKKPTGVASVAEMECRLTDIELKIKSLNIPLNKIWRSILKTKHHSALSNIRLRRIIQNKPKVIGFVFAIPKTTILSNSIKLFEDYVVVHND